MATARTRVFTIRLDADEPDLVARAAQARGMSRIEWAAAAIELQLVNDGLMGADDYRARRTARAERTRRRGPA